MAGTSERSEAPAVHDAARRATLFVAWLVVAGSALGALHSAIGWHSARTEGHDWGSIGSIGWATEGCIVTERTLVLIKPDAVSRGLVGEILTRLERKGLVIEALHRRTMSAELADEHYAEHVTKAFYPPLKEFMTSGPLIAAILSGDQAIEVVRGLVGATDGRKAAAGTIRGDFSMSNRDNLVHASDSPQSAKREIGLWFPELAD